MASIYEIEYRYDDEYKADEPTHNAFVCVYETGSAEGDTIQYALDKANEDSDWSGVDKLLGKLFGLKDEDICFYFDANELKQEGVYYSTSRLTRLVPELQKDFDIVIEDIWVERTSNDWDTSEEEAYEQDREWDKLRHGRE